MTALTLKPRKEPRQKRSRQRVDSILDTTAELLVERGVEAVTTDLIAKRAGIPVGSVYQFFPNKYAILYALAVRQAGRFIAMAGSCESLATATTWQEWLDSFLDVTAEFLQSKDAIPALWPAIKSIPELAEAEVQGVEQGSAMLEGVLAQFLPQISKEQRAYLTRMSAVIATAMLYHATQEIPDDMDRIVADLKGILKQYVQSHLDAIGA